ncbi:MAG TPA: hypothetical protein VG318_12025 [Actinomycetota bacterium]|nr:hypothetical protein [Actinomycetota bacterium]
MNEGKRVVRRSLFLRTAAGGSMELEPDAFRPQIVISTGKGLAGSIEIPVVSGDLRFGG